MSITNTSLAIGSFVSCSLVASKRIWEHRCWRLNMFMMVLSDSKVELMGCWVESVGN